MTNQVRWSSRCILNKESMYRLFLCLIIRWMIWHKPKELIELTSVMKFVIRCRCTEECNSFVQVKGSRLAQFSGASPLNTGYYLTLKAARNQLRCLNPFQGNFYDLSESWVIIASNVGNELWKVNIIEIKEKWVREKDITVAMPENSV